MGASEVLHPLKATLFHSVIYLNIMLGKGSLACPTACFCDEGFHYVSCVGDGSWVIPSDIPKTVIRLELRNYMIPYLSSADLTGLVQLQELIVQQAQLHVISNDTFLNLKTLKRLDLSQNLLTVLNRGTFDGVFALRYLDVSSNFLVSFEEAFGELSAVEQLNLRANQIPRLTAKSLTGLRKIQYLNLDSNNISLIEVGSFQYLTNLAHLILSNNPLTTLCRLDFFGNRLQYIDISHIGIQRVPQSLTRFVRDLRLAKNNITYIPAGDLESYNYIELLVLDDNNITEIENDALGRLEFLNRLWLNGNKLSSVPVNLPPSLSALYIEENRLKKVSSFSFQGLINLEQLFLQRNQIEELEECAFCDLFNLKSLDLQANKIRNLTPGIFEKLSHLQILDLSQNEIKLMEPRCFFGLNHLQILQVSRISSFVQFDELMFDTLTNLHTLELYDSAQFCSQVLNATRALHGLRNLRELNIMHNNLINLRSDFPSFFPKLKIIKMSGNTWHCNQSILWLQKWITTSTVQFYQSYDIRCASPLHFKFKPIMLLKKEDFTNTQNITSSETKTDFRNSKENGDTPGLSVKGFLSITAKPVGSSIPVYGTFVSVKLNRSQPNLWIKQFESNPSRNEEPRVRTSEVSSYSETVTPSRISSDVSITPIVSNTRLINPIYTSNDKDNISHIQTGTSNITRTTVANGEFTDFLEDVKVSFVNRSNISTLPINNKTMGFIEGNHDTQQEQYKHPTVNARRGDELRFKNTPTPIVITFSLVGGCLLVLVGLLISFVICRHHNFSCNAGECKVRRSSNISYSPQRDEVSILTVPDGTMRIKTNSHYELGNKLYYFMESNDAYPDQQFQELLPRTMEENGHFLS
ncbi:chondroadherin-like protein [Limulus polyphemus]|uniref:Chondroadherin-like protein n=1 Tax=Limulus polyphemus TaxID=6850 RepID=A0ABM1SAK3_LIMPO|nr:chondroadherin-like protein [Limulus polyphemus]XP_022240658.1 chondroadherin-like protein [Limulus polyphemus]